MFYIADQYGTLFFTKMRYKKWLSFISWLIRFGREFHFTSNLRISSEQHVSVVGILAGICERLEILIDSSMSRRP